MERNHKLEFNCKGKCPKCEEGELLPFVKPVYKGPMYGEKEFDHYEVVYRCDHCNFHLEEDTFLGSTY